MVEFVSPGEEAARWITDHLWDGNLRIYSELTALILRERQAASRVPGKEWLSDFFFEEEHDRYLSDRKADALIAAWKERK